MNEAEKNFIVCAVLISIAGVGLILTDKMTWAIVSFVAAVGFVITAIVMYVMRKREEEEFESEKSNQGSSMKYPGKKKK